MSSKPNATDDNIIRINPNAKLPSHSGFDPMDSRSRLMDEVRAKIMSDGRGYKAIAEKANVSPSTIGNLATGRTKWPRTIFNTLHALGYTLDIKLLKENT